MTQYGKINFYFTLCAASFMIITALSFQYIGGLFPCPLCIKQRLPYIFIIALSLLVLLFYKRLPSGLKKTSLFLCFLAFLTTALLGIYHSGVEWNFWGSATGCDTAELPTFSGNSLNSRLQALQERPLVSCASAPWYFLGLSMAGWNAVFALVFAFTTLRSFLKLRKKDL